MEARDQGDLPVTQGGDPITVELASQAGVVLDARVSGLTTSPPTLQVNDLDNGHYEIHFTPSTPGTYCLNISIFARLIKVQIAMSITMTITMVITMATSPQPCPLYFPVTCHNAPLVSFGMAGTSEGGFLQVSHHANHPPPQPSGVVVDLAERVYVADTGNCRIKVLSADLEFVGHLEAEVGGGGRAGAGARRAQRHGPLPRARRGHPGGDQLAHQVPPGPTSPRRLAEVTLQGELVRTFTHRELKEPVAVCVSPATGHWIVADLGARDVLVFEPSGRLVRPRPHLRRWAGSAARASWASCLASRWARWARWWWPTPGSSSTRSRAAW